MTTTTQYKKRALSMLAPFFVVLFFIFMPLFPGPHGEKVNGLDYLDNFFNELSKGSAYHIDEVLENAKSYTDASFTCDLKFSTTADAEQAITLFKANQVSASIEGEQIKLSGDFASIMEAVLQDADKMYQNDSKAMEDKYGIQGQEALYGWYKVLGKMDSQLNKQKAFEQAKFVQTVMTKAIEPAYNYYTVEVKPVKDEMVLLAFALIFYVVYTVWYGFGLLFLFEGLGIRLEH